MSDKPKRHWFRFSLRTLFVVVTLFCVWLGWQVRTVQERKALLQRLEAANSEVLGDDGAGDKSVLDGVSREFFNANRRSLRESLSIRRPVQVSFVRRLLGDQGIYLITLPDSFENDRKQFVAAFPEGHVTLFPSSALSTETLIEFLDENPHNADELMSSSLRACAIDVLGKRKAKEAIPHLIECLSDVGVLPGFDGNWVGAHAANALASITGRDFNINQAEWRKWWKEQQER